jgi:flagellar hook assembly protein FlgD
VFPQPAHAGVRIVTAPWGAAEARLEILDLSGRLVRRIEGAGASFTWDGRAADGRPAPAGVYLARVVAGTEVRNGRICLVR